MVASLHPAEGKGRGQGSPFSGACFVFQIGQGHIGRVTPVWILTLTPIPSLHPSFHNSQHYGNKQQHSGHAKVN